MAKLYFKYGAMNAGKSTMLMQTAYNYKESGMRVIIIKPLIDTKGNDTVVSRLGVSQKVDYLATAKTDLFLTVQQDIVQNGNLACVFVDECQFLTPKQAEELFWVSVQLDIPVLCYGLRSDFLTKG